MDDKNLRDRALGDSGATEQERRDQADRDKERGGNIDRHIGGDSDQPRKDDTIDEGNASQK
jgi:hypothetical protein